MTPRGYLSYTQVALWEKSPAEYIRRYVHGEGQYTTPYMALGSAVASALEGKDTADEAVKLLVSAFPSYPQREHEMTVELPVGRRKVKLLAKVDGIDMAAARLGEYKTGTKWTRKQAEQSRQLRFYHLVYWMATGRMLEDVCLHWAETAWSDGQLRLTGNITTFPVTHTRLDLLKEKIAVKKAFNEIETAYKKELSKLN